MKILADEGLNGNLIKALRDDEYSVQWVQESHVGMADENIIALARENQQILITEDKDFGEWVFAHRVPALTIVFLRYAKADYEQILNFLRSVLVSLQSVDKTEFITINKNKVRRRQIDF